MKIIYSQLKLFLPDLKKRARDVADDLTMIGHFAGGFEKKQGEEIIDLEVKQNRADCLGYYGIAKELSVFYNLPLKTPEIKLPEISKKENLDIKVTALKAVERIMALRVSDLKNSPSPTWLKKFLTLHDINSLNTLIDLTNYVSLLYGIPSHAFDTRKSGQRLIWEINKGKYKNITTFDETNVGLEKGDFLISNGKEPVSLPFVGGKNSGIDLKTSETIIEIADYDRVIFRKQAKKMNIVTEASIRLEKDLDPELIPQALSHLVKLVLENCGGKITSNWYDNYLQKEKAREIIFDSQKPSNYAGITISKKFSLEVLKRLRCRIQKKGKGYKVTPPTLRKDLNLEEDLIEEVIRFYGYNKIPINQPLQFKKLKDITPKAIYLNQAITNILISLGYDETRSWPLIKKKDYYRGKELPSGAKVALVQNSPDSRADHLRGSIISSLPTQVKRYQKYKVKPLQFFEIGKVFYQLKNQFQEDYSLGLVHQNKKSLEKDLKTLSFKLGADLNQDLVAKEGYFLAEINLKAVLEKIKTIPQTRNPVCQEKSVIELEKQIVVLDANVSFKNKQDLEKLIKKYISKIGDRYLWNLVITDIYYNPGKKSYKYTLRAYYYNLDDKTAKKIHLQVFDLKTV